ncbi:MAG: ATP-binding protein [Syntrophales bacterium]|jgi:heavy metal sensor kinase|nr:ATP-binding protein [Syntrophales bacterium]
MSLKKPVRFRNSLTLRLTLWYTGIFAVFSLVAFFLFYTLITSVIQEKTDQDLLSQAGQFSAVLTQRGIETVEGIAVFEAKAAGEKKVFFRFLYPNGQVFSSSNMDYWKDISINKEAIAKILGGDGQAIETVSLTITNNQVRILYAMIGPGVILQVGQSMENYRRIIEAFKGVFLATMALLIALAAGIGWFMARRAVSGVEAVTITAQSISGGTLEKRVPVKNRGDEIDQLAVTFNQMLDRIQSLVAEIRQMGDDIAHDLKSPLTRIRGMAEITLTTGKSLNEYETMAASVIEECDLLQNIINTMLMISRTEAGVEKPSGTTIDLAKIVKDGCELFGATAEDRNITLSCNVPEECMIQGDARMIQRLLFNLLDNAIKYTPAAGVVRTSLSQDKGSRVILKIEDTGIGISAVDIPRIFERFYRGDKSRSASGSGLGLSLARAIARAHGGDIRVVSRISKGSVFTVTLPISLESSLLGNSPE